MGNPFRLTSDAMFARPEEDEQNPPLRIVFLSVEGNKTEEQYFRYVEKYRNRLGIKKEVHIHSLKRSKRDNSSAPDKVLELLEEYIQLREAERLPEKLRNAIPAEYSYEYIVDYVNGKCNADDEKTKRFASLLHTTGIDLEYDFFLKEYKSDNDVFGIVIDRDYKSHSVEQMEAVLAQCRLNKYKCFVTTPLFEFWLLMHLKNIKASYGAELDLFLRNDSVSDQHTFTSKKVSEIAGHSKSISESTFVVYYLPGVEFAIHQAIHDFPLIWTN